MEGGLGQCLVWEKTGGLKNGWFQNAKGKCKTKGRTKWRQAGEVGDMDGVEGRERKEEQVFYSWESDYKVSLLPGAPQL